MAKKRKIGGYNGVLLTPKETGLPMNIFVPQKGTSAGDTGEPFLLVLPKKKQRVRRAKKPSKKRGR